MNNEKKFFTCNKCGKIVNELLGLNRVCNDCFFEKTGHYYYVKLRSGVKWTPEMKKRIDKFVNKNLKRMQETASDPIDLEAIFTDKED